MLKKWIRRASGIALLPASLLLAGGVGAEVPVMVGGACSYQDFAGTARFVELRPVTAGIAAFFEFTPADATAPTKYRFQRGDRSRPGIGVHSAEWLAAKGIAAGSEFPAIYQELRSGTCTPLAYVFPTLPDVHAE